jgi:hypothetical protein
MRGASLIAVLLLGAAHAHAQSAPSPTLHWVRLPGAEDCIAPHDLATNVEQQMLRALFASPSAAGLTIEGFVGTESGVTEPPRRYQVRFVTTDPQGAVGERQFVARATSCRELDALIAFIVVMMIDPNAPVPAPPIETGTLSAELDAELEQLFRGDPPEPPPLTEPSTPAAGSAGVAAPTQAPAPSAARVAEAEGWHWGLQLGPALWFGGLPQTAFGLAAAVEAAPTRAAHFGLSFRAYPGSSESAGSGSITMRALLWGLDWLPAQARFDPVWLELGLRLEAGVLLIETTDLGANQADAVQPLFNPGLVSRVGVQLGDGLGLVLTGELTFPVIRDQFVLEDPATGATIPVHQVASVLGQLVVALRISF